MEAIVDDLDISNERLGWIQVSEDMQKPVFNRSETEMSRLMTLMLRLPIFSKMSFNDRLYIAKNITMRKAMPGELLLDVSNGTEEDDASLSKSNIVDTATNPTGENKQQGPSTASPFVAGGTVSPQEVLANRSPGNGSLNMMLNEDYLKVVESATMEAKQREEERKQRGFEDENTGPTFCIIVFGTVGLQQQSSNGRIQTLLEVGDTFGSPLVTQALPGGSAYVANSQVEMLCISPKLYKERLIHLDAEDIESRIEYFRKLVVPVFSSMSDKQLSTLAHTVYPLSFQSKELVVREGEPGDSLYFILRGKLKVVREIDFTQVAGVPAVKLLELATLVEGEYFGELSFIRMNVDANRKSKLPNVGHDVDFLADDDDDDEQEAKQLNPLLSPLPRQATVYAHTPCTVLVLPRQAFIEQIRDSSLVRMREYAKGYPTQADIRAHFTKKQRWEGFKGDVMGRVANQR